MAGIPPPQSSSSFWHTQPSSLLAGHRSTRDLPTHADIVIVGSGMTGASVAHHLLATPHSSNTGSNSRRGFTHFRPEDATQVDDELSVVMLEAREVCWGATGRNGGHCYPAAVDHPHDPSVGQFEIANFNAIRTLVRERNIDCEFVVQKGVRAIYSPEYVDTTRAALKAFTKTAPELASKLYLTTDKKELADLRLPTASGALVLDTAARLWPYKFVAAIVENLITATRLKNGRTFNLQSLTPVQAITQVDGAEKKWKVKTDRGSVITSKVILATNAYTAHLLPSFRDLIVPCRGQMSALVPPPSIADDHRLQSSYGFHGHALDDYLIQRPNESGGHLMFGGGRQMGPSMNTIDDDTVDENVAAYLRHRLIEALGVDARGKRELTAVKEWTGIMGYSRDDHPWVGQVPPSMIPNVSPGKESGGHVRERDENSRLFLAAGYTGHGMPNAWLCGKAVANMVLSGSPFVIDADADDAERLPKTYMITKERVQRARSMQSVEEKDWAELTRRM